MTDQIDKATAKLRETVAEGIKNHATRADSFYHNGGTALALAATSTATIIPTSYAIWAKAAAAVATFTIAVARALDFGGRWRWHIEMRTGYQALVDRIDEVAVLPDAEQLDAIRKIYDKLEALRLREGAVPGSGAAGAAATSP